MSKRILHVVGARPDFVKVAPIMRAFGRVDGVDQMLVHTGQHYDDELSASFFEDLAIPRPDVNLGIGSGSHAVQTARAMIGLEPILTRESPDWVFTVGHVNSTLAAALVARKMLVPVAHVEAGLRSRDWTMPEEVNQVVTDRLSEALFTTEPEASDNLLGEGIEPERIHFVGNVMIDTLDRYREVASALGVAESLGLESRRYAVVTLHRPYNVDREERFAKLLRALTEIVFTCECEVVWPVHPRAGRNLRAFGLDAELKALRVMAPLSYLEFLALMDGAGVVITDSGGVQEETSVLGVPCITVRPTTDRPITLTEGTNRLFDGEPSELPDVCKVTLQEERRPCRPRYWDGQAADRIVSATLNWPPIPTSSSTAPSRVTASPSPASL